MGTLREVQCTLLIITRLIRRMKNALEKVVEKIKTHVLPPITFFPKIVPFMR